MTQCSSSLPSLFLLFLAPRYLWHTLSFDQNTLNVPRASDVSVCNNTELAFLPKPCSKIKRHQSLKGIHDPFLSPSLCGLSPHSHFHLKESNPPPPFLSWNGQNKKMRVVKLPWAVPPHQDPPHILYCWLRLCFYPTIMSDECLLSKRSWYFMLTKNFKKEKKDSCKHTSWTESTHSARSLMINNNRKLQELTKFNITYAYRY